MRPIKDYGLRDWLIFDPIRHRFRRLRNLATLAAYQTRNIPRQQETLAELKTKVEGKVAVFTVAFNVERNLELLAEGFAAYSPEAQLIVCDNSPTEAARRRIEAVCKAYALPYFPLPYPPLRNVIKHNFSLSHGIALTWIFYHLVRPLKPKIFAFFDHDLIPTAPIDFSKLIKNQPLYGLKRTRPKYDPSGWWRGRSLAGPWNLWAGYCVYDFAAVADLPLDFTGDNPLLLDTGGQNWTRFYRHLDTKPMRFAPRKLIKVRTTETATPYQFHLIDELLLHIGGASYREDAQKRLRLVEYLLGELRAGRHMLDEYILNEDDTAKPAFQKYP